MLELDTLLSSAGKCSKYTKCKISDVNHLNAAPLMWHLVVLLPQSSSLPWGLALLLQTALEVTGLGTCGTQSPVSSALAGKGTQSPAPATTHVLCCLAYLQLGSARPSLGATQGCFSFPGIDA